VTSVTAIVENEVADEMEATVEAAIAQRLFGDADTIAVLDVNTEVEE